MYKHLKQLVIVSALLLSCASATAMHCPFCSAINLTFTQQMNNSDVVVIAKLTEIPKRSDDIDAELPKASFEITQVMKGDAVVAPKMTFKTLLVGKYELGQEFLVMGADPPAVVWTTPMKASDRVIDYVKNLAQLPEKGPDRLAYFQGYFEDDESILAFDAYDEFAGAPYEDLIALKNRMPREKLLEWIKDPETVINRRRLYFTMLGVCGQEEDIELLEGFLKSGDRKQQAGLDALIACYLNLKKEDGVDLIEKEFISNKDCDYVDTLAAVSALRFHGTEVDFIPRDRIVTAMRKMLDRPKMADMIIPDLARWEDWTVVERLVQMFKDADDETNWVRVPVVNYLRACPDPKAKKYIEELREIDPDAIRRAEFFAEFDEEDDWGDDDGWGDDDDGDADAKSAAEEKSEANSGDGPKVGLLSVNDVETTFVALEEPEKISVKKPFLKEAGLNETPTSDNDPAVFDGGDATLDAEVAGQASLIPAEIESATNSDSVATVSNSMAVPSLPVDSTQAANTPAEAVPAPVAQTTTVLSPYWAIIFLPMLFSAAIFILLWSVINGWFERLIF